MSTKSASELARQKAVAIDERYWINARLASQFAAVIIGDFIVVGALVGWVFAAQLDASLLLIAAGALVAAAVGWWALARRTRWLVAACVKSASSQSPAAGAARRVEHASQKPHDRLGEVTNTLAHLCLSVGVAQPTIVVVDDPSTNLAMVGLDRYDWTLLVTRGLLDSDALAEPAVIEGPLAAAVTRVADGTTARTTAVLTSAMLLTAGAWKVVYGEPARWWHAPVRLALTPLRVLWTRGTSHVDDFATDEAAIGLTRYPPGLIAAYEAAAETSTETSTDTAANTTGANTSEGAAPNSSPFGALWLIDSRGATRSTIADRIAVLRLY